MAGQRTVHVLEVDGAYDNFRRLIDQLDIKRIDLMVLDVEAMNLRCSKALLERRTSKVLCVEHGHLGVETVRKAVERLGYTFDGTSHVNSFFYARRRLIP